MKNRVSLRMINAGDYGELKAVWSLPGSILVNAEHCCSVIPYEDDIPIEDLKVFGQIIREEKL